MKNNAAADLISKLLLELATELDLHYDDEDMHALREPFGLIRQGIGWLTANGYSAHVDVNNIVARFHRAVQ
jgi:hypothetical protein